MGVEEGHAGGSEGGAEGGCKGNGEGGGAPGGGRGGNATTASVTLRRLSLTPSSLANDAVMVAVLRNVWVAAAASSTEPSRVTVMVTDIKLTIGAATVTLTMPRALAKELVSKFVSCEESAAFELRESVAFAGIDISNVV